MFVMTNAILTLNQSQGRCPEVGAESALICLVGVGVWGRGFSGFYLTIVPLQLPDDQTKCEVNNNCVPGYVSTHSSGKKPAAKVAFSLGRGASVLYLPCCEGSSISLQSPCSLSLTCDRTEVEAQIFVLVDLDQINLDFVGWIMGRWGLW